MMRKLVVILLCIIVIGIAGCSKKGDLVLEYDNDSLADSVINKTYSKKDIEKLERDIDMQTIHYSQLESQFDIQCIRKTFQGYYIVFYLDDGREAFLFLNNSLELTKILSIEKFYKEHDFDFVKIGETTMGEIIEFDINTFYYPVSSVLITGHILSDGLMFIQYDRVINGKLLNDPVVKTVTFIRNDDIEKEKDDFWISNTPFILEIDKGV